MLGYDLLQSYSNIFHFVTTRLGGVGSDNYATFNCTSYSGDNPDTVCTNRGLLCESIPQKPMELIIPYQVHDTKVAIINKDFHLVESREKEEYLNGIDALITDQPGYCICVSTADCVPLLLFDPVEKVIAAVHAGWRGTVNRIVEQTVTLMKKNYCVNPGNVIACIGPSISVDSFEVGDEVCQHFSANDFPMNRISVKNAQTGKWHIDLWEANRLQLMDMGLSPDHIELAGICSYKNDDRFFSARRLGIHSGRTLSGIMLKVEE